MRPLLEEVLKNQEIPYRQGVLGSSLSTFRIGGQIALLAEPRCEGELIQTLRLCQRAELSARLLGRGSNVLFGDGIISDVIVHTVALDAIREENGTIFAACGVSLYALCAYFARLGLCGMEFACGIPGTLGGALLMNAGAYGGCIGDLVESVRAYNFTRDEIKTYFADELNYSYRKSAFQCGSVAILSAKLRPTGYASSSEIRARMHVLCAKRREAQPLHLPNAGSVFKRPSPEISVGKLLDELGLKGLRCGAAAVSDKHAGFIVNHGGATANDVMCLIEQIQKITQKERGIRLEPELCFIPEVK